MNQRKYRGQQGFTIPELLSVMIVTAIFSGLLLFFSFNFWRGTATLYNDSETFVTRLNASDRLRELLGNSSGLIIQNSIPDSNVGNPDPTNASGQFWLPIHAIPGTASIGSGNTITPLLYFRQPVLDSSKNFVLNGAQPYENEFVLYLNASTKQLLLRSLANSGATTNSTTTSCPSTNVSSTCPADKVIADNISSVTTRYFSRSGNLINYQSATDPSGCTYTGDPATCSYAGPDFPSVEVVELTLNVFKKSQLAGGQNTTNQTVIRIALRNA